MSGSTERPTIKQPTPVHDQALHEKVEQLTNANRHLVQQVSALAEAAAAIRKSMAREVAKGVFFGALLVGVILFVLAFVVLPVLASGAG